MDFKSLSSLSENLLSWSAEVPLKNPKKGKQRECREYNERIPYHCTGLTSVRHVELVR